jgi:hypothetical protein
MKRKAEAENTRARTRVRNQEFSRPPTPRFAHAGERDRGKLEQVETSDNQETDIFEPHLPSSVFHDSGDDFRSLRLYTAATPD